MGDVLIAPAIVERGEHKLECRISVCHLAVLSGFAFSELIFTRILVVLAGVALPRCW